MEWEDTKENYAPVRQGRTAAALSTPLSVTSVTKRSSEVDAAKRPYLEAIQGAEDPLPAWLRYIKWTQEQLAAQGSKQELQQVLEAATKGLSSTDRYNSDVRLLRIWIQYADCLPDPTDVFLYLEDHAIGRDHTLLYEAYATYLELKGNFKQAELVYQEGINRLAKPLERLKLKQAAFQQRMAKRIQRQTSDSQLGMTAATDTARATLAPVLKPQPSSQTTLHDENGRPIRSERQQRPQGRLPQTQPVVSSVAAGVMPAAAARSALTASRQSQWGCTAAANSTSLQQQGGLPVPPQQGSAGSGMLFAVMVDDEFGPSGTGPTPVAFPPSAHQQSQLPGYKASRKENTADAGKLAGAKVKQQAIYTAPTAAKLLVLEDEDTDESEAAALAALQASLQHQQPQQHGGQAQTRGAASSAAMGTSCSAQQQVHDSRPARDAVYQQHDSQQAGAVCQGTGMLAASSSGHQATVPATSAWRPAGSGYHEKLLVGSNGTEMSFEEVRAAACRARHSQQQQPQQHRHQYQQHMQQASQQHRMQQLPSKQQLSDAHGQLQQQLHQHHAGVQADQQRDVQQQQEQPKQQALCSDFKPDVMGQEACEQFRQVGAARKQATKPQQRASAQHVQQSTMHQRAAAEQLVQQQATQAHEQQQQQPAQVVAIQVGADPTVTVNTRAALESLNMMFSSDMPTMTLQGGVVQSVAVERTETVRLAGNAASRLGSIIAAGSRKPAGAADPTVTVNTRAALEAMNGMFGSSDETATMHGLSTAVGRGPHPGFMAQHGAAESTVTVNTKQALEYMNNMFADSTSHSMTIGQQRGFPKATGAGRHRGTSRLSMAAAAGNGSPLGLREDTDFIIDPVRGATGGCGPGQPAGDALGLYEDTCFMTGPVMDAAGKGTMQPGRTGIGAGSNMDGGLGLYEDTDYLTRPMAATASLDRLSLANRMYSVGASAANGSVADGGGLFCREDTEFVTCPVVSSGNGGIAGTGLGCNLGIAADTEFLTDRIAASAAQGGGGSHCSNSGRAFGSVRHQQELLDVCSDSTTGLLMIKENLPAAASVAVADRAPMPLQVAMAPCGAAEGTDPDRQPSCSSSNAVPAHPGVDDGYCFQRRGLSSTPGKPPAGPGVRTPGRAPGTPASPWARQLEEFEVMDSPAVKAAMDGRPPVQMSPASSMPSPGWGARENQPIKGQPAVPTRSMHDRAARAAALQPLSGSRAEMLGVLVDPEAAIAADADEQGAAVTGRRLDRHDNRSTESPVRPHARALRSLKFQSSGGQ